MIAARCCLRRPALAGLLQRRSRQKYPEGAATTMRPWLIMFGAGLGLIGLPAAQAQVVIDVTKITCQQFLEDRVTDTTTLSVWLNGYVNGAHGKTLINPLSSGRTELVHYCEDHTDALVLEAARKVFGTDK
jgi:acid stress chaperone HdeB